MSLPPELTRLVYEYADDEELAKLCMLNRNFSTKVCNSDFWMKRIIDRFGLKPEEIRRFKGTNTLWAYYKHLSVLNEEYKRGAGYGAAHVERIYNHPEFKDAAKDIFIYNENPEWLNESGFESDMLYKLVDLIVADYIKEYYDDDYYNLGDIGTYSFINSNIRLSVTPELRKYIIDLLNNIQW